MGVFDIKSNGLVIANNGETKLINKHCVNNKKARFVNVEIPPTKLTYRISELNFDSLIFRGIFIQARPIESTDDNDFVGLLGVITQFRTLGESSGYANEYLYCYADTNKRKYLSEYGVVGKDTENETFYTNGDVIETVDISSFPESPSDTVLYRMIEDGEKHYYRYYSDNNLFVRVYFSTDIIDLTYKPSIMTYRDDVYEHVFNVFHHNSVDRIDKDFNSEDYPSTAKLEYDSGCIPSVLVSNNIKENIEFNNAYEKICSNILMIKQGDTIYDIPLDNEQYIIIPFLNYEDNIYTVTGRLFYVKKDYNIPTAVNTTTIYSSPIRGYGGPLLIYNQNTDDERYFTMYPDIKNTDNLETYLNEEHNSEYSFIYFKPYTNQNDIYNVTLSSTSWEYTYETPVGFSFGDLHNNYYYILTFMVTELEFDERHSSRDKINLEIFTVKDGAAYTSKIIRNVKSGMHIECKFRFKVGGVYLNDSCFLDILATSMIGVKKLVVNDITLKCINPEHDIKKDINRCDDIYPIIIKDVSNDQLSEIYFCQSEEKAAKDGYPTTYIGQPMLNKRIRFKVPYSVAFLNSKVPGHFPYTTYNIWSGKKYINIALPQTEYNIAQDSDPIISARRFANSTKEPCTSFIAKVFPGSYIIDPDTKTVKTSGTIRTIRLYNFIVYETHTNVTLKPYYQNGEILYWYYSMQGQEEPESLGNPGSIELRLYNNLDSLDNPNTLCMICDFNGFTYFDLIGIELFNFNLKQELVDAEGNGVITATSTVTNPIYDVMLEQDDELELPYHYSYSSSTKKLHIDMNSNVIKYPIGTYGRLTVNETYIGPYVIARSKNINFNFTEDSTLNNIINENPNVVDYDGPHVLTVDALPRSFERITDYYDTSIGSFRYYRERYRTITETIEFSRTMDFDTSKSLYLTFNQFNIYTVNGNKKESHDLHYRLEYNSYHGGWYDSFYDDIVDEEEDDSPGYISLVITNTGITITLNDYATYNNDESAWSIEILNGLSLYQEED